MGVIAHHAIIVTGGYGDWTKQAHDPGLGEGDEVMTWNERRALSGLIEVARDALQTAQAIATEDDSDTEICPGLTDLLFTARATLSPALELVARPSTVLPSEGEP